MSRCQRQQQAWPWPIMFPLEWISSRSWRQTWGESEREKEKNLCRAKERRAASWKRRRRSTSRRWGWSWTTRTPRAAAQTKCGEPDESLKVPKKRVAEENYEDDSKVSFILILLIFIPILFYIFLCLIMISFFFFLLFLVFFHTFPSYNFFLCFCFVLPFFCYFSFLFPSLLFFPVLSIYSSGRLLTSMKLWTIEFHQRWSKLCQFFSWMKVSWTKVKNTKHVYLCLCYLFPPSSANSWDSLWVWCHHWSLFKILCS